MASTGREITSLPVSYTHLDVYKRQAPVVKKYTGVLAAADVEEFTRSTTFMILQSMRLDQGAGSQVHP